jgi:hypothetical protein
MKICKTCELIARRDAGAAPPWDCIHRTPLWDVAHAFDTALPGWLVWKARLFSSGVCYNGQRTQDGREAVLEPIRYSGGVRILSVYTQNAVLL